MSTDIEGTFWGEAKEEVLSKTNSTTSNHNDTLNNIGITTNNKEQVYASCKNQEVKDLLKENGLSNSTHNARQSFEAIKVAKGEPHLPLPYKCRRTPPDNINVYTDGSWTNPLKQFLGLGGLVYGGQTVIPESPTDSVKPKRTLHTTN